MMKPITNLRVGADVSPDETERISELLGVVTVP